MPLYVRKDGVWQAVMVFVKKAGVWKEATPSVRKAGSWEDLAPSLTVALDYNAVSNADTGNPVATTTVTATPSGGTAPYTYAWTFDSRDAGVDDPTNPTSAGTQFTATGDPGTHWSAIARCTVTDDDGNTAYALCAVDLTRNYP